MPHTFVQSDLCLPAGSVAPQGTGAVVTAPGVGGEDGRLLIEENLSHTTWTPALSTIGQLGKDVAEARELSVAEQGAQGRARPASSMSRLFITAFEQDLHEFAVDMLGAHGVLGRKDPHAVQRGRWVWASCGPGRRR